MKSKYEPLGAWGDKGVSYFLNKDTINCHYYLFKVTNHGKTKSGRVRVISAQASKLVSASPKKGKKLAEKIFNDRSHTLFGEYRYEQ